MAGRESRSVFSRAMLLLMALAVSGALAFGDARSDQSIRVGLCYGPGCAKTVSLSGIGEWRAERGRGALDADAVVTAREGQLVLRVDGRQGRVGRWVEAWPTGEDSWLMMDGQAYRGTIRIELQRGDGLKVVNQVELEDYVRGVVPNEMFADGGGYRVQAVIARTYALYVRDLEKKHAADGFDICATGHCQVYRGVDSEKPDSDAAVAETRGQVLTYRGRPIFSAYHSNAGGETETVDEAWPGSIRSDFPYLPRVASPYDDTSKSLPGYEWCWQWERGVTKEEIRKRLAASGRDVGTVRDLLVRRKTESGRVRELEVVGSRGRASVSRPQEVEDLLGTPSALFDLRKNGDEYVAVGSGHGHGVGLSQHGALGMARAGYTYEEILGHYYRGVELTEDYGRGRSRRLAPPDLSRGAKVTAATTR